KCETRARLRLRGRRPGRGPFIGGLMTPSTVVEPTTNPNPPTIDLGRRQPTSKTPTPTNAGAPNIRREINAEQVCILTFDRPNSSANVFDRATLNELNEHLDFAAAHPELGALFFAVQKNQFSSRALICIPLPRKRIRKNSAN